RRVVSASGTVRDITDRKEIEERLRTTNARFEAALRGTPMTVFNQDRDLRFTWVYNPVGVPDPSQIVGKTESDILEPEDAAASVAIKQEVLRSGKPYQGEYVVTLGGKRKYYHANIEPQRNATGEIIGLTCSSFDLTDLREAQAENDKLARQRQLALDAAKMGWWRYDLKTGICAWDAMFKDIFCMDGFSGPREMVVGRIHPEDQESAASRIRTALQADALNNYTN